jgi:hypothetical protein
MPSLSKKNNFILALFTYNKLLAVVGSRLPNLFKPDTANRALENQNPGFASALIQ